MDKLLMTSEYCKKCRHGDSIREHCELEDLPEEFDSSGLCLYYERSSEVE